MSFVTPFTDLAGFIPASRPAQLCNKHSLSPLGATTLLFRTAGDRPLVLGQQTVPNDFGNRLDWPRRQSRSSPLPRAPEGLEICKHKIRNEMWKLVIKSKKRDLAVDHSAEEIFFCGETAPSNPHPALLLHPGRP